jgi:prophage maintenance system killer protein
VRNHPFNDGDMRVTLVVMAVFLELNGCEIEAPEAEVATMILDLAAAVAGEGELGEWLRSRLVASRDEQSDRRSGSAAVRKNVGRNSC